MAAYDPKRPNRPVPIARQAACLRMAADRHGYGFWSYIARYGDISSHKMPDAWAYFDVDVALLDAATTMERVAAHEAEIRAFLALAPEVRAAVVTHGAIVAELAVELAKREAAAKAGGPRR